MHLFLGDYMIIEETESFLVFREVNDSELSYFKDFPYTLWFLEGVASDQIFQQSFTAASIDFSAELDDADNDDDLKVVFTLYFYKKM